MGCGVISWCLSALDLHPAHSYAQTKNLYLPYPCSCTPSGLFKHLFCTRSLPYDLQRSATCSCVWAPVAVLICLTMLVFCLNQPLVCGLTTSLPIYHCLLQSEPDYSSACWSVPGMPVSDQPSLPDHALCPDWGVPHYSCCLSSTCYRPPAKWLLSVTCQPAKCLLTVYQRAALHHYSACIKVRTNHSSAAITRNAWHLCHSRL